MTICYAKKPKKIMKIGNVKKIIIYFLNYCYLGEPAPSLKIKPKN